MIKNLRYKNKQKFKKTIPLNSERNNYLGKKVFVAFPIEQEKYSFRNQAIAWISPIKFDQSIQVIRPPYTKTLNNNEKQVSKAKSLDFLQFNVEIGKLWVPLTKLLDNYAHFCEHQATKYISKNKNINTINIMDDWIQKKEFFKELYDSWIDLMNNIEKHPQSYFKETRSLIFRTGKLIFPLTKNGLGNNRLIETKHPIIVAWIGSCIALASISSYTHAIVKNNEHLYDADNLENLKNKVNDYGWKFVKLLKTRNFITHNIRKTLVETKAELDALKLEPYFLEAVQDYFSTSTRIKALLMLNETDEVVKLCLKLIDCKKSDINYFVKS